MGGGVPVGPVTGPGENVGDGRLLVVHGARWLALIRWLPFTDRFAFTAPQLGGASRVLLHLTGSV